jgi:hypothetical protein
MLRTRLTLRPGQNGTKKLVAKYGHRLVAVRYQYDAEQRRRLKTVEIIEEIIPWDPPHPTIPHDALVVVQIEWRETRLRAAARSAGGHWDPKRRLWTLPYGAVADLGLEARIVDKVATDRYIPPPIGRNIHR